ncbi:MAG: dockerin type I domain-containing protein, partial [Clostridiales bacterium]|nr:dockerin type I domain-containing protein [Clostridiales bacterium]
VTSPYHTLAVKTDGSLWAWGLNDHGQLGDGTRANRSTPVKIGAGQSWGKVSAGEDFSVAFRTDGDLWSWGTNRLRQFPERTGISIYAPVEVKMPLEDACSMDYTKDFIITVRPTSLSISAPQECDINGEAEYTMSAFGVKGVKIVEAEFEIDGSMIASKRFAALNGFEQTGDIFWSSMGGDIWKGKVTITYQPEGFGGFTSESQADIAKFIFAPKAMGDATLKLTSIRVVGYGAASDQLSELDAAIEIGEATTRIDQLFYSKYDLTKDNVIDVLDLGIMLLYCGERYGSPTWSTLVKVNDSKDKGVTASMCDVNGDGTIDMLDLLDLFIHYTK